MMNEKQKNLIGHILDELVIRTIGDEQGMMDCPPDERYNAHKMRIEMCLTRIENIINKKEVV